MYNGLFRRLLHNSALLLINFSSLLSPLLLRGYLPQFLARPLCSSVCAINTSFYFIFFYVSYSFLEIGSGVAESGLQQKSWPDESCLRVHNVFYKADLDAHSAHQMRSLSPTTPTLCAYAAMIHLRSSPTNATTARGTPFLLATVRERSCVCVLGVHGAVCAGSCVCLCVRGWSNKRAPLSS